jgi:cytochrome c peroxidase
MTLGRWITAVGSIGGVLLALFLYERYFVRVTATPIAGFSAPFVFGRFNIPADNPLTEESFRLGRRLFYDPALSGNNKIACATCHLQKMAFTDGLPKAVGITGRELKFSSMSLTNLLWGQRRFFWNGRATSLEEQALLPIQDPNEMDQDLDDLVSELRGIVDYRTLFGHAYGEISAENIAKALATFMRLLISSNSKYDRYLRGETKLSRLEEHGRKLFMAHPDVKASQRGANCIDCHSQFLTSGFRDKFDGFSNNGLDGNEELPEGLQAVTKNPAHRGLFKVPTLRNIAVTAPYMHDGRFDTLEQVLDHYNNGIKVSETLSPLILEADNNKADPTQSTGLNLNADEVKGVIAFLHTLTDEMFLTDPKFSNPLEGAKR